MSSFARTIQKRALRKQGMHRRKSEIRFGIDNMPYVYTFPKGKAPIFDADGNNLGLTYPYLRPSVTS